MNFLLLSCFLCICFAEDGENWKRLLLDDPTVISNRLTRLEKTLEILNRTVNQQAITIQQQTITIQHQAITIQQQTTTIQQQATAIGKQDIRMNLLETALATSQGTGSTYVIWGRKQCPNNSHTEQVYSGFAGGGLYSETGSAAEYVCLPPNPDFDKTSSSGGAHMYGAEFSGLTNEWGTKSSDEDVPCALCRTELASTIMISGKNKCYPGWIREYYGYLAAGYYRHSAASSYVCVDIHPEYLNGGARDEDGKLFHSVIAKCGSLQCPPYIDNYPLTCVVCSK